MHTLIYMHFYEIILKTQMHLLICPTCAVMER